MSSDSCAVRLGGGHGDHPLVRHRATLESAAPLLFVLGLVRVRNVETQVDRKPVHLVLIRQPMIHCGENVPSSNFALASHVGERSRLNMEQVGLATHHTKGIDPPDVQLYIYRYYRSQLPLPG